MKIYTTSEISQKMNKRKNASKIIKKIIYPIVIVILICNIWLVIQKIKAPEEPSSIFGYKAFNIVSGSMEPNLKINDLIIVKNAKQEDINIGDIISFKEKDFVITHRIVELIEEDGKIKYKTKGDNNNANDDNLVEFENIEGKFAFKIGNIGGIISNARSTTVIIPIVIIIYFIYVIVSRKSDRKDARHEKRKEFEENIKKKDF